MVQCPCEICQPFQCILCHLTCGCDLQSAAANPPLPLSHPDISCMQYGLFRVVMSCCVLSVTCAVAALHFSAILSACGMDALYVHLCMLIRRVVSIQPKALTRLYVSHCYFCTVDGSCDFIPSVFNSSNFCFE